ncbi:hypothetical protein [Methanobrevibacter sp.]|uniref:hypothetical protein n=1 Tax=Methanobrevibacter sp. TaxID=66852 RepID=UPI00388FF4C1
MTELFETSEEVKKAMYGDDYDTFTERKYNFAIIRKTENEVVYEEMWILVNAYYDYVHAKFIKIDKYAISLGIQLQAKGNNPGYNFWMCPAWLDSNDEYIVEMDEDCYDYTDMKNEGYIGAEYDNEYWGDDNGTWRTFGIATGWNPSTLITVDSALSSESENPVQNKVIDATLSDYVQKSQTSGLLKNDGTVDTNTYLRVLNHVIHVKNVCTITGIDLVGEEYDYALGESVVYALNGSLIYGNDGNGTERLCYDFEGDEVVSEDKELVVKGDIADSDWTDLTLTGNFYNFDSSNKVQYRKVYKTVQITGLPVLNANPAANEELIIGALPEGCRPPRNVSFVAQCKDSVKLWTCTVKANGDITFKDLRDPTDFIAGTAFSDVLVLNVTFFINP